MRKFDETTLPSPEEKLKIFKYTIDFFEDNGYRMIGMDHFWKGEDELFRGGLENGRTPIETFQGYTKRLEQPYWDWALQVLERGIRIYWAQNYGRILAKGLLEGRIGLGWKKFPFWSERRRVII